MKTDLDLQSDVADELAFDPAIDNSKITIGVKDGIVTLRGTVPSYYQRTESEDAVKLVGGVRGVANELDISLPDASKRDDTDIAKAAADALAWHTALPQGIKVAVTDGYVTLSGQVDWQYQKDEAEDAVAALRGVVGVLNKITIKTQPKAGDVRAQIQEELDRTVDEETSTIDIQASDGRVTLSGNVDSWTDFDAAARAAWSVPGVTDVQNNLVVV